MLELDLLEKKEIRDENIDKIEVLEQVKKLLTLPKSELTTVKGLCEYYSDVPGETVKSCYKYNKEEIDSDGVKKYTKDNLLKLGFCIQTKRGGFNILDENGNPLMFASGSNDGILLFTKRAVLRIGMLLTGSKIAEKIRYLLTGFENKIYYRREIAFVTELDKTLEKIKNKLLERFIPTSRIYPLVKKVIDELLSYERQYEVNDGQYRIDFYFYSLDIAVEYDEEYHKYQQEEDRIREEEIEKYINLERYYKDITKEKLKQADVDTIEELYILDLEYSEECMINHDKIKFIRVQKGNEIEGLIDLTLNISLLAKELLSSKGMNLKYEDLLKENIHRPIW